MVNGKMDPLSQSRDQQPNGRSAILKICVPFNRITTDNNSFPYIAPYQELEGYFLFVLGKYSSNCDGSSFPK